ncbi:PXA domain-containing protein, partial [Elsinoe ampelina]
DRALQFFSHASNETLGACFVGLGASTYLVLGRVGLVLIGVVGGIALHATWESSATGSELGGNAGDRDAQRRRELGLEVVQRVWRWRDRRQDTDSEPDKEVEDDLGLKMFQGKSLDFSEFQPETAEALDVFTTAVIRDYVKWWYSPVLPGEEDFPAACRQTFTAFLLSLSGHVSRKRPTEMFLNFAINSSSIMIAFFSELAAALNASPNSDAASAIDTYMQMKPDSSLAQMLDQDAQAKKLSLVSEDILQNYLDPKAYNFPPVRVFLHQVMSKLVLGMTLESCSKPDWINGWIVYLLEDGEPEIMQVIDASVESATEKAPSSDSTQAIPKEVLETSKSPDHQRHKSRAEEAMEEALQEAKRLTELIAEDESKKAQAQSDILVSSDVSEDTTQGIRTPTSSQSESERNEASRVVAEAALDLPGEAIPASAPPTIQTQQFTSFDQILPFQGPETPSSMYDEPKPVLTLHNAKVSIFDDSMPGEKTVMKSKPNVDYLIQIEPADSRFSGWMIARKYMDFEVLHEVLRRISVITGVRFTELHGDLPGWKKVTKPAFRDELEKYLTDAMKYQQLAESEGMKRFLDKEQGLSKSPASGKGLGWPDPLSMGKGMMDVLAKAPKEVAGGGKAIFGGVAGVLGGGSKKSSIAPQPVRTASSSSLPFSISSPSIDRQSSDLASRQLKGSHDAGSRESLERPSSKPLPVQELRSRASTSSQARSSIDNAPAKAPVLDTVPPLEIPADLDTLNLPPPPSAIDEYETPSSSISPMAQPRSSIDSPGPSLPPRPTNPTPTSTSTSARPSTDLPKPSKPSPSSTPLTTQETTVTLDLLFAVISELYTLSSAWTFRRTLLQAARTYLLRPGNPQLETIRLTLQESIIDAHSSDAGVARLILKTRENSLPTEEELAGWPKELGERESEALRVKARRLLVERGMPMALTSVMGQAASGEALGRVFDCLQIRGVARSLEFGLLLQGLRAVVQ